MSGGTIVYKTAEEIEYIRNSSLLVGKTLAEVAKNLKPGVTTSSLDAIAEKFIRDHGATPSFKGYHGFKHTLCISVNEEVVHGMPGARVVKDGDVVSIDCGVFMNGYHGDSAYTFPVGEVGEDTLKLLRVTKTSLLKGIEKAKVGNRIGDISATIQGYAEENGYGVVRELVGHGIGKQLHEKPEVANYGKRGSGPILKAGMTIAIEPMINQGTRSIIQLKDGWTIITGDRKPSAHYEHTIAITEQGPDILSTFSYIELAIEENSYIKEKIETLA
ncbi:MAG: type I methionyl aminopeptidase [Bacteroidetes bacterium]|nr:type I methionyl aminopeptidase [Bacteroidota bacterium]